MTRLISYAEANSLPGSKASIGLIAAKGKEPFYEKMGFAKHPHDTSGAGMTRKFIAPDCTADNKGASNEFFQS